MGDDGVAVPGNSSSVIERNWPTGTRKTKRYYNGILPFQEHIEFLTAWRAQSLTGGRPQTNKGKKRGEVFQMRSALRDEYPGWHTSLNTIKYALRTKLEWSGWLQELVGERNAKLRENREKKKKRTEDQAKRSDKRKKSG